MRVRIWSDIHLEDAPIGYVHRGEDAVILAGDISENDDDTLAAYGHLLASIPVPVIAVPGNHEPWRGPDDDWAKRLQDLFARHPHATLLGAGILPMAAERGGWGFVGTYLNPDHRTGELDRMRDAIRRHADLGRPVVVVTHCLPALSLVDPESQRVAESYGVCAHLAERMFADGSVRWWFCGHQHASKHERIGALKGTIAVSNPRGNRYRRNAAFDPDLIVDLESWTPAP